MNYFGKKSIKAFEAADNQLGCHNRLVLLLTAIIVVVGVVCVCPVKASSPVEKQGYFNSTMMETTPLVWQGELYLLENWRKEYSAWPDLPSPQAATNNEMWIAKMPNGPGDYDNRTYTSMPMSQHSLGSALVYNNRMYVFGVNELSNRQVVDMTWSDDLINWSAPQTVLQSPGGSIFNVAATADDTGFTFLWETDGYGSPFTMRYGHVQNLTDNWNAGIISNAVYGADKYTGGPALYHEGGYYYTTYLESLGYGKYETRVTRSQDLVNWEDAPRWRPIVTFDPNHVGLPLNPTGSELNASDLEFTYFNGQTVLYFSGGDQLTSADLQWAKADVTPQEMLEAFYAPVKNLTDADGLTASVNSCVSQYYAGDKAIDGSLNTFWLTSPNHEGTHELIIDLHKLTGVEGVEIDKFGQDEYDYRIYVSEDGVEWRLMVESHTVGQASVWNGTPTLAHGFQPLWARYIRFETDAFSAGIYEFRVYEAEVVPEPMTLGLVAFGAISMVIRKRSKR